MTKPDLVIGDSQQVIAEALKIVLVQQHFAVPAVATTLAGLWELLVTTQPRLCLLDRRLLDPALADGDTTRIIPELLTASPDTRIVVLTGDRYETTGPRIIESGAAGYLHKANGLIALVAALRRIDAGETVLDRGVLPARPSPMGADVRWRATYLTDREQQCLTLLVEGLGTAAMANRLGVRTTTVRTHVQSLMSKLGVHSRLEAATLAVRYSLPQPEDTVDAPAS